MTYEFVAPLTDDGHLDEQAWDSCRDRCTVRRFWAAESEERGHLVRRGSRWLFHYEGMEAGEGEPVFKFDRHSFRPGDYLAVTEHDGRQQPFKIVSVADVP